MSVSKIRSRLINDAAVSAVIGDRVYYPWLPQDATLPAISITAAGDAPVNHLSGEANLKNERYQIDIWAKTLAAADSLRALVQAAMAPDGADFTAVRNSKQPFYEDATRLHRYMLDYSIWFTE